MWEGVAAQPPAIAARGCTLLPQHAVAHLHVHSAHPPTHPHAPPSLFSPPPTPHPPGLDLDPIPKLQLAWLGGPEPDPPYASVPATPAALSRHASASLSRGASRPASAARPQRPRSSSRGVVAGPAAGAGGDVGAEEEVLAAAGEAQEQEQERGGEEERAAQRPGSAAAQRAAARSASMHLQQQQEQGNARSRQGSEAAQQPSAARMGRASFSGPMTPREQVLHSTAGD